MEELDDKFTKPLPQALFEQDEFDDIEYDDASYTPVEVDYTTQS